MAAVRGLSSSVKSVINNVLRDFPHVERLRKEQEDCLTNLVNGKDVFAILPTGFGKSLIFQLFPRVMSALNEKDDAVSTIIVISPLVAIMKDQVDQLMKIAVSATAIGIDEDDMDEDLLVDSCRSPEDVFGRFAEGVSPVGDLAFVCRFAAFSDSLSTIPANNFTTLACVLVSVLAQVKQLTSENLGSLFRSCPNELARSANTKLSASTKPTKSLLNTSLKRDTLGIFAVPRHLTFFWFTSD